MPTLTATTTDVRSWGGDSSLKNADEAGLQRVLDAAIRGIELRVGDWRTWTTEDIAVMDQAAVMTACRLWIRKSSPNGVLSFDGADGAVIRVTRFDPDVEKLLEPYDLPGFS